MPPVLVQCSTVDKVNWQPLPRLLPVGSVVICRVSIPAFKGDVPFLTTLLTPDELARAGRYHQAKDRQRFIVARGVLRLLMDRYTGLHPGDIRFVAGVNKKPFVTGFPELHYNLSHAGSQVVIAVGPAPVGVDVERIDPDFAYQSILPTSFSLAERQYIHACADRRSAFYRLWTRKEALTKATAKGIDDDFDCIPSLDGLHPVAGELIQTNENWLVTSFRPADDYVAAVAYPTVERQEMPVFYSIEPGGGIRFGDPLTVREV